MAQQVAAPQRRERQGGIKSIVGEFVTEPRLGGPAGSSFVWEDSGCITSAAATRAGCYDETVDDDLDAGKEPGGYASYGIQGDPFARYVGAECFIGGDEDGDSYEAQAQRNLQAIEDREVEALVADWAENAPMPGEAETLVAAIAAAEKHADNNYVGAPVVLLARDDAEMAVAAGALKREDGRLVTGNGNWVLSTGKATSGTVSVLGMLAVYASPMVSRRAIKHTKNVEMAIAERVYAFGVDCDYRFVVEVTTP